MAKSKIFLLIYLLLVIFFHSNCQNIGNLSKFAGHYVENSPFGIKHDLRLFEDGSFQYIIKEGLANDTIFGNWKVKKNRQVILLPIKTGSYHFESMCDTCAGRIYIKIYAFPDNYELNKPNIKVYEKGVILENILINSMESIVMQKADSIQINYFGFKQYMFIPQNRDNVIVNVFLIEEKEILLQKDRILKVKKSKLVTDKGTTLKKQL